MLPGIHGFHWQLGHLVFIGIFLTVVAIIFSTSALGFLRSASRLRRKDKEALFWKHHFHDLPSDEKSCRHAMTGELKGRTCPAAFNCTECETHAKICQKTPEPVEPESVAGLEYPVARLYHRGHTWVEAQSDGTVLVGLDDFARKLLGQKPDRVQLPSPGKQLTVNGTAWTARKSGAEVRILAPISGEVLETGGPDHGWYLRISPDSSLAEARHLLSGSETAAWVRHELERLQAFASNPEVGAVLADGGELVDDLSEAFQPGDWDHVCSSFFLQP